MKGLRIYLFAFLACVALDEATAQQDTATVQPQRTKLFVTEKVSSGG